MDAVKQINNALLSRIQLVLPDHKELDFSYFPQTNNFYNNFKRYGTTIGSANSTPTITKALSFTQIFSVILTDAYKGTDHDESDLKIKIFDLHDRLSNVLKDLYWTNLGLPNLVYQVAPLSIDAPFIVEAQQLIILTSSLNIQYRLDLI